MPILETLGIVSTVLGIGSTAAQLFGAFDERSDSQAINDQRRQIDLYNAQAGYDIAMNNIAAQSAIAGVNASAALDRKSTRLNSSHTVISYAVFCLKKKKQNKKKKKNKKKTQKKKKTVYILTR